MATAGNTVLSKIQNYGHNVRPDITTLKPRWLVAAPYVEQEHLLDLDTLDAQSQLFALALTKLANATDEYAIVKYEDAIDFGALMAELRLLSERHGVSWKQQDFYVVEFRSKLKEVIDNDLLFKLDKESHREAMESGGLLKYWYGVPDAERRNLATCFWRLKEDAIKGGRGPWHKQARSIVPVMYEDISIRGLRLVIDDDVKSWSLASY